MRFTKIRCSKMPIKAKRPFRRPSHNPRCVRAHGHRGKCRFGGKQFREGWPELYERVNR